MLTRISQGVIPKSTVGKRANYYEVLAVTSGKGGVGKSTISANMAINFKEMNKKVLLVDADIHLGNIDLILGTRSKYTLADVVHHNLSLEEVIIPGTGNIDVLPASSATLDLIETEDVFLRKLSAAFENFNHHYDYIVVDTGAGIAQNVISFLLGADKIVLIITPDPASITDAYAVIKVVRSLNQTVPIFLSVNMVNSADEGEILFKKMNLMVQKFLDSRIVFGGSILKDDAIARSVRIQKPFILTHPNGRAANAIRVLNRRLIQAPVDHNNKNIFDRLINNKKVRLEWNQ